MISKISFFDALHRLVILLYRVGDRTLELGSSKKLASHLRYPDKNLYTNSDVVVPLRLIRIEPRVKQEVLTCGRLTVSRVAPGEAQGRLAADRGSVGGGRRAV